ncbi:immunoglobulin I-set domain protein [Dictyocaulus viviparus]|uniref:Immunoglobulin I-set domain protein n=1 Tax=Dictyocaulus viviparus TaxID=29172 RepID=A0A0D8XNA6_DICVI|nr:immunoglobulin I-set domain protein [Dictyocaulus viviparus]
MPMQNIGVAEGEFCRFETQLAPINDPYMKIEWFKDKKPVLIGHRFRSTMDFGFVCLDLLYALPDDTGEYLCVATNKYGRPSYDWSETGVSRRITRDNRQSDAARNAGAQRKEGQHEDTLVTENEPARFECAVIGYPRPKGHRYKLNYDGMHYLTISNCRISDAGEVVVIARNSEGEVQAACTLDIFQVTENEPARFECAVIGYPRPKGHRYKLNYDGMHYLTISNCRISDAGEVVVIARNSEGEVQAACTLDIFQVHHLNLATSKKAMHFLVSVCISQKKDWRQKQLKPAHLMTSEELQQRQSQWQKETLGTLGEAFDAAPKPDARKLLSVERSRTPIEPLETEELLQKFTRPRDEQFYDQLAYVIYFNVETAKPHFKGMELEPVQLKPGQIERYQPPREEMESVALRAVPTKGKAVVPPTDHPDWAQEGGVKLPCNVDGRFKRLSTPPKEVDIPARDQVALKTAKPKPASEDHSLTHDEQLVVK